jgi:hypothetical protein
MKLSTYATILAIVALLYGIGLLFIPAKFTENYGVTLDVAGLLMTRLFGALMTSQAILFWLNRNIPASEKSWNGILLSSVFYNVATFVIALTAVLNNVVNSMGWSTVILSAIFALASSYFAFKNK